MIDDRRIGPYEETESLSLGQNGLSPGNNGLSLGNNGL